MDGLADLALGLGLGMSLLGDLRVGLPFEVLVAV